LDLQITPFTILVFSVSSVPWQNGRILFINDSSGLDLRFYILKSILPWWSGIWQNGRILFEKACQTGSKCSNIFAILP
jgi:hypothetical protein